MYGSGDEGAERQVCAARVLDSRVLVPPPLAQIVGTNEPRPVAAGAPPALPALSPTSTERQNELAWTTRRGVWPTPRAPRAPLVFDADRPWLALTTPQAAAERAAVRDVLAVGRMGRAGASHVRGGVNGTLDVRTFTDDAAGRRVRAVLKPIAGGGAQEVFAYEVARAMHLDHLVPAVARRRGGVAAIELRPGKSFTGQQIFNANALEHALRHGRRLRDPDAAPATIARQARVDRELVQAFDAVLANGDRHGSNALFDARTGALSLIDHGLIDRYDPQGRIPTVRTFLGGANARRGADRVWHIPLSVETRAILRAADRDHIRIAFARLLEDQASAEKVGEYARKQTPRYLEQLMGRLDDAIRTGVLLAR